MYSCKKELANDKEFCEALAAKLQIQADGGDSPGEFVSFALKQVAKEASIKRLQKRIKELEDE